MIKKLFSAIKGGVNDAAEAEADKHGITIMRQELRNAEKDIAEGEKALGEMMAQFELASNVAKEIQAQIEKYTNEAISFSENNNTDMAEKCAIRVSELQSEFAEKDELAKFQEANVAKMNAKLKEARRMKARHEDSLRSVESTEKLQKAQQSVSKSFAGSESGLSSASDSLERIIRKQAETAARLKAASDLEEIESGSDLDKEIASHKKPASGSDALAALLANKK